MTLSAALLLFVVMVVLAAVPSASVVLVVTRSVTGGVGSGAAVAAGIVLGDLVFVTLALLGMSVLAEWLGGFFGVLKIAGGAYLIWMGWRMARSAWQPLPAREVTPPGRRASDCWASLLAGWLLTLGDVKAIFFYASLFPLFVEVGALQWHDIVAIVAITVVAVGGVKIAYAFAARSLAGRFEPWQARRGLRLTAGSILAGTGAYVLAKT